MLRKLIILTKYVFFVALIGLSACYYNEPTSGYRQFTKDDLSYLYFDKDTLVYAGGTIEYNDTLIYYLNGTDSTAVKFQTKIYSYFTNPFSWTNIPETFGETSMHFNKEMGVRYMYIKISRDRKTGYPERTFVVGINSASTYEIRYAGTDTLIFDTALVRGKIYQDVLKLYPPEEDGTNLRLIYFAKKYGYIKIEKTDGTKIERIAE